jgi:UDP-N-acetylglucosamine 2-epimerase
VNRLLFVAGTRPEGIKLAPVILEARKRGVQAQVCTTAQHRELLDGVFRIFGIEPDYDLDVMTPGQTLAGSASRILAGLAGVVEQAVPDIVVVQGDTTTTFVGALCGFYAGVRVAHVEAGLRTGHPREPFPEEMNRVLTTRLADLHFAPTDAAAANLRAEGVEPAKIRITGNTGIDAVLHVRNALDRGETPRPDLPFALPANRRILLVTAHRRETLGEPLRDICRALKALAARGDTVVVFPVHPNPGVRETVGGVLADTPGVWLIEPLHYVPFVDLLRRSWLVLTDSGGIQEEAPSLGKPVVVLRDKTERPEGVSAGSAVVAGTNFDSILRITSALLDDSQAYERMSAVRNPYGDGSASARILDALAAPVT